MKVLYLLLLAFPCTCFSRFNSKPNKILMKGSFFIIAAGSDGVMIATESRGSFFDNTDPRKKILAYYDSIQKSFIIGKNVFVCTGVGLYGNWYLRAIIDDYKGRIGDTISATKLLESVMSFCKKHMDSSLYKLFQNNTMATVGYENSKINICYYQPSIGKILCTDTLAFIESGVSNFMSSYSKKSPCKNLAYFAEKSILKYSRDKNLVYQIGGPIRVILLNKDTAVWIKNKPSFTWDKFSDFLKSYKKSKDLVHFVSPEAKIKLEGLFEYYLKEE